MPIETTLQPRQKWWNILYTVICAVLGLWGAYDYWVTIPRKEEEVARYEAAATKAELSAVSPLITIERPL